MLTSQKTSTALILEKQLISNFLKHISINKDRILYLMKVYGLELDDLLDRLSEKLKNRLKEEDIITDSIQLSHLKRIDRIFNKGLAYYTNPSKPSGSASSSIFFRKQDFSSTLNLGSRKIVNQYEDLKNSISALTKLSEINIERKLPYFNTNDDPRETAIKIRDDLYPPFKPKLRDFLKELIYSLSNYNIFVYEFVEAWNKKDKANIDGFYLSPHSIILKRNQKALRREIFTLAHELGHYLLDNEDIDELSYDRLSVKPQNNVERWCNDFAFHFLAGPNYGEKISDMDSASSANDYHHTVVQDISNNTHLSVLAIYTRMLLDGKISRSEYDSVSGEIKKEIRDREDEEKKKREIEKSLGQTKGGRAPKPINSPLFERVLQAAYLDGVIGEMEFCKGLKIKPNEMNKYLI